MKKITTNPYGIKTPTTIGEFRENLKKYYVVSPTDRDDYLDSQIKTIEEYPTDKITLSVVVHTGIDESGDNEFNYFDIPLMDLTSLTDLYEICGDGEPMISPKMDTIKDYREFLLEQGNYSLRENKFSYSGYFTDENNFKIYDTTEDYIYKGNPTNWDVSSLLLRDFLVMTLGEYSGYEDKPHVFSMDFLMNNNLKNFTKEMMN